MTDLMDPEAKDMSDRLAAISYAITLRELKTVLAQERLERERLATREVSA